MKKLLLLSTFVLASLCAKADYSFMEFNYSDGAKEVISATGLTINVENGLLEVTNSDGESLSIEAAALVSMQFTNNDPAGVKVLPITDSAVAVYGIDGMFLGKFNSVNAARLALKKGIYVIRNQQGETIKLVIGK